MRLVLIVICAIFHRTPTETRFCPSVATYMVCVRNYCDQDLAEGIAWEDSAWCPILGRGRNSITTRPFGGHV